MTREDIDAGLWRLLVNLEHSPILDEWRPKAAESAILSRRARDGAISVRDKYGNIIKEAA